MNKVISLIFILLILITPSFAQEETISVNEKSFFNFTNDSQFETYFTFATISLAFLAIMWMSYSSKNARSN